MIYSDAPVSTGGQTVAAQVAELRAAGAEKKIRKAASGARTDRRQLRHVLEHIAAGDVFMATRLDLLARSTRSLLNTVEAIPAKRAGFQSLAGRWADTTTSHGRLMLTLLGGLAEVERAQIRARTAEGRIRAVRHGVKLGRNPKLTPYDMEETTKRRDGGEPVRSITHSYNVRHGTISRLES